MVIILAIQSLLMNENSREQHLLKIDDLKVELSIKSNIQGYLKTYL